MIRFYFFKGRPYGTKKWWFSKGKNLHGINYVKFVTPIATMGFTYGKVATHVIGIDWKMVKEVFLSSLFFALLAGTIFLWSFL